MLKKDFLKLVEEYPDEQLFLEKIAKYYYITYADIVLEKIKYKKMKTPKNESIYDYQYIIVPPQTIEKLDKKIEKYNKWKNEYIFSKTHTSKAIIVNALRKLWLWSRERSTAIQRDNYSCVKCGIKRKKARHGEIEVKVDVHHKAGGINWDRIIKVLREELFVEPDRLETVCRSCHLEEHNKSKGE